MRLFSAENILSGNLPLGFNQESTERDACTLCCFLNTVFVAMALSIGAFGADRPVRQVEIDSSWGGLGKPQTFHLTIRADMADFDPKRVQGLVEALGATRIAHPTRGNLGLSGDWLKANARRVLSERNLNFSDEAENLQRLQIDTFSDVGVVDRLLPQIFDSRHTDDYPSVRVRVTFADGTIVSAESHAQGPYMLPWTITPGGRTYDARIARAVAALLPARTVNRDRLNGDDLPHHLADAVLGSLKERLDRLDAGNRAGSALNELRKQFNVERSEVNPYHGPAYGKQWEGPGAHETNLHVRLHRAALPGNLVTNGVFLHSDGKTEGIEGFLARGAKYESMVTSTPWLWSYIRSHPKVDIEILYVHDVSFGDHALETFAKDMQARGKLELIDLVRLQQREITLLVALGRATASYWLLFPDHRMVLWRFEGSFDLLKWKSADFGEPRCGDYQGLHTGCPGAEITPEGTLVAEPTTPDAACMAAFRATHFTSVPNDEPLFPIHSHNRGGFINRRGETIIPLCFDTVGEFSEGLARFERAGRWGYLNRAGTTVIPPRFPWAQEFSEGLARVQLSGEALGWGGRWGFIDKSGKVVIQTAIDLNEVDPEKSEFHEGLAIVGQFGKKGFIDKSGKLAIARRFGFAYSFHNGIAAVSEDSEGKRWGFIDKTGQWAIPPRFDWAAPFEEGLAAVNRKRDCGFIDRAGVFLLKPPVPVGETDCAAVWGSFHDGLARWKVDKKFGYIDHTGKTVIEPRFDFTSGFSEGLAVVQVSGLWGYVDTRGTMVIEPRELHSAGAFHNGLACVVTKKGEHGYIDPSGKYVWGPAKQTED